MKKIKPLCICFILIISAVPFLYGQLDEQIDLLLEEESAGFGRTVYLVLAASGHCDETESVTGALGVLKEKKWDIGVKGEGDAITLGEYAYLLMKAFNMKGGLMYKIFPGPRYAVRELAYRKLILDNPVPGRQLSGEEVMTILTRVLDQKEGNNE